MEIVLEVIEDHEGFVVANGGPQMPPPQKQFMAEKLAKELTAERNRLRRRARRARYRSGTAAGVAPAAPYTFVDWFVVCSFVFLNEFMVVHCSGRRRS